jgi:hypothetical protein
MRETTTQHQEWEAVVGPDPLTAALRCEARGWIERMLHEELAAVLGGARHERTTERQGYRPLVKAN